MLGALVDWLFGKDERRTDELPEPFPADWRRILDGDVLHYRMLPRDEDRAQLERDVYWLVRQKTWTPIDLEIDDRKRVVIAGYAALLLNRRLDLGVYPRTREIIVRPTSYNEAYKSHGPGVVGANRLGEAWYRGPVVLAWSAIRPLLDRHADRHNVIIHEFAHKLDFLDGSTDGTPPLESRVDLLEWARVFTAEFDALVAAADNGTRTVLDKYGATNTAEFFAVATEAFFCFPRRLQREHGALYDCLRDFFRHDPATWPG